jgi:hypothetical protein
MALAGVGCIVTASPDFTKPEPTPPYLTSLSPFPGAVQRVISSGGASRPVFMIPAISFDVVSEDLSGPGIDAQLLLDYQGSAFERLDPVAQPKHLPPGHLNSPQRTVDWGEKVSLHPETSPGCHTLTAVVSHAFVPGTATPIGAPPLGDRDVAMATWFLNVEDPINPDIDLNKCFTASASSTDAGAEGAGP